jgi:peptide/nickel transport system substrate-binding protein
VSRRSTLPPLQSRPLLVGLALVVVLLLVVLLVVRRPVGTVVPAEGGTLVERALGPVERVNPLLASTPAEHDLAALVFAGLVRFGPGGEPLPDVAESWETSGDGRSVIFTIRRDLSWHDGAPVRVEDVIFSMGLLQAGVSSDPRLLDVWRSAVVSRVAERRVRVDLPAPFAALPAYATFGLLPEHLLRDVPPSDMGSVPFNQRPVGMGPFRLLTLDGDHASLERYDRYHLGAPYLDRVELRFGSDVDGDDAAVLGADVAAGDRVTYPLTQQGYAVVMLNNDSALFATDTVRRALSLAVDRRALVTQTLGGRGAPTDVPFAPGSWAHDGREPLPPDLDLARQLLESAGWSPGPDGVLRRGNRDLRFTLVTADDPVWTGLARVLAESWSRIGARVTVAPAQEQALLDDFLNPRQYEAALIGWDPGLDPDPFSAWHSSLRGQPGGNPSNFADEVTDSLLVEGRMAGDEPSRRVLYDAFQARFRELSPSIVLFTEIVRYAVREQFRISLPASGPNPSARFSDIQRWFIHTRHGPVQ